MPVELKITGEDSAEVMNHVRDFAGAGTVATAEPAKPDPEPVPEPEPEKPAPKKRASRAKKKPEPEPEAEPEQPEEKPISFDELTEAATKFIEAMEGNMRAAQDKVQSEFGVRKISQIPEDQYGDAYRWLVKQTAELADQ